MDNPLLTDERLAEMLRAATEAERERHLYGTANAEYWVTLGPEDARALVAEVRRLRGELLKRNIPLSGCQCPCHGCQWCQC